MSLSYLILDQLPGVSLPLSDCGSFRRDPRDLDTFGRGHRDLGALPTLDTDDVLRCINTKGSVHLGSWLRHGLMSILVSFSLDLYRLWLASTYTYVHFGDQLWLELYISWVGWDSMVCETMGQCTVHRYKKLVNDQND